MKATYGALLLAAASALAQDDVEIPTFPKPKDQSVAWNSSFKFTPEQMKLGQLWPELAEELETILNWDRTQLANGGPSQDSFYTLGDIKAPKVPGEVLKVERVTDPTAYTIPAKTAMSRFIYSSTNANGTLVPASGYVLWPWTAKQIDTQPKGKAPVALWSHGTSGYFADGSPSAHRSLFYHNIMPYTLAQAGYVVVATDYAGLGVSKSWDGSFVPHQYQNRLAQAFDSLNALRAARKAFAGKITTEYVNIGHSQGGAAAWGVSEVLASDKDYKELLKDYLGSVIFAPGIDALASAPQVFGSWIGKDLQVMYPDFKLSDWMTPLGVDRTKLLTEIQGGQYVSELMLLANVTEVLKPTWNDTWYADAFTQLSNPGNRPYAPPMLMFHGTDDNRGDAYNLTAEHFSLTCKNHFSGPFEFVTIPDTAHFPSMESSRHQWLSWIEDRFGKKPLGSKGCTEATLESMLPSDSYQQIDTYYPEWAGKPNRFFELVAGGF